MKRMILIIFVLLSINIQANDELKRDVLDINEKMFIIKFPEGNLDTYFRFFNDMFPDSAVVIFDFGKKSKTKKEYFEKLTFTYRWFLKNHKIGKAKRKNLVFIFKETEKKYLYAFKLSINNLKLLNNRDFGVKDFTSFNDGKGMVYPLKMILRKGKFIKLDNSADYDKSFTDKYNKFLDNYSISMSETAIESFFKHKKIK
jgi:hypothetical protein